MLILRRGGTFSKVLNSVGMKTVCVLGARVRHQGIPCHLRCCSLGSSISCHRPLQWGYVCNKQLLCNYLLLLWLLWFMHWNGIIWGGLGDWAGMRTSRLRLKPAKTEITREVQQAGGGGEDRKDKPVSALPPNSAALYTQIKFEAQRSCYRRS